MNLYLKVDFQENSNFFIINRTWCESLKRRDKIIERVSVETVTTHKNHASVAFLHGSQCSFFVFCCFCNIRLC